MTETQTAESPESPESWIRAFGARYGYDVTYLLEMLKSSPAGFESFQAVEPMATFRSELPLDAHYVARISAMRAEDCGPCTQLTLRMAVEAGIDRTLLQTLVERPEALPPILRDVRDHAHAVASNSPVSADRARRLEAHFGDAAFIELGLLIAGSRMYPTMKRSMLHDQACIVGDLDF